MSSSHPSDTSKTLSDDDQFNIDNEPRTNPGDPRNVIPATEHPVSTHRTAIDCSGDHLPPKEAELSANKTASSDTSYTDSLLVLPKDPFSSSEESIILTPHFACQAVATKPKEPYFPLLSSSSSPDSVTKGRQSPESQLKGSSDESIMKLAPPTNSSPLFAPSLTDSSPSDSHGNEPIVLYQKKSNNLPEHPYLRGSMTPIKYKNLLQESMTTGAGDAMNDSQDKDNVSENDSNDSQMEVLKWDDDFDMEPDDVTQKEAEPPIKRSDSDINKIKMAIDVQTTQEIAVPSTKDIEMDTSEDLDEETNSTKITDVCPLDNKKMKSEATSSSNLNDEVPPVILPTTESMAVIDEHRLMNLDAMIQIPSQLLENIDRLNLSGESIKKEKESDHEISQESNKEENGSHEIDSKEAFKIEKGNQSEKVEHGSNRIEIKDNEKFSNNTEVKEPITEKKGSTKQALNSIVEDIDSLVDEIDRNAADDDTDSNDDVLEKLADILETSSDNSPRKSNSMLKIIPTLAPKKPKGILKCKEKNTETTCEDKKVDDEVIEIDIKDIKDSENEKRHDTSAKANVDVEMSSVDDKHIEIAEKPEKPVADIITSPKKETTVSEVTVKDSEDPQVSESLSVSTKEVAPPSKETDIKSSSTKDSICKEVETPSKLIDTLLDEIETCKSSNDTKSSSENAAEIPEKGLPTSMEISQTPLMSTEVAQTVESPLKLLNNILDEIETSTSSNNIKSSSENAADVNEEEPLTSVEVSQTSDVPAQTSEVMEDTLTLQVTKKGLETPEVLHEVSETLEVLSQTSEVTEEVAKTPEMLHGITHTSEVLENVTKVTKEVTEVTSEVSQTSEDHKDIAKTTEKSINDTRTTEEFKEIAPTSEVIKEVADNVEMSKEVAQTNEVSKQSEEAQTTKKSEEISETLLELKQIADNSNAEFTNTIEDSKDFPHISEKSKEVYQTSEESKKVPQTSKVTHTTEVSKEVASISKEMPSSSKDLEDIETFIKEVKPVASTFMSQIADVEVPETKENSLVESTLTNVNQVAEDRVPEKDVIKEKIPNEEPEKKIPDTGPETDTKEKQPTESTFMNLNQMASDEVQELDSLGLLAESSRVMDYDENDDPETPEEDDEDDEDDPDYDGSSNQAEDHSENHSEESNQMQLESELSNLLPSCSDDTNEYVEKMTEKRNQDVQDMSFALVDNENATTEIDVVDSELEKDGDMEIDVTDDVEVASDVVVDVNEVLNAPLDTADGPELAAGATDVDLSKQKETQDNTSPKPASSTKDASILLTMLSKKSEKPAVVSPSKQKTLAVSKPNIDVNIVDLEESSEEDVVAPTEASQVSTDEEVTNVNIPTGIEIMASGEIVSEIKTVKGEIVISGIPKPATNKLARLNTDEISIKTGTATDALVIPETQIGENHRNEGTTDELGLQVFSLDSDDDEISKEPTEKSKTPAQPLTSKKRSETPKKPKNAAKQRCINPACPAMPNETFYPASRSIISSFDNEKKKGLVCESCLTEVMNRAQSLIDGVKNFTPLLELSMRTIRPELVEISDSDDSDDSPSSAEETLGLEIATKLESELAGIFNEQWRKYKLDERLQDATETINKEIDKLNSETKEFRQMQLELQAETDKLRESLYATFEPTKERIVGLIIYDTPDRMFSVLEPVDEVPPVHYETRQSKRRLSSASELPAKKQAVPVTFPQSATGNDMADNTGVTPHEPAPSASVDTSKIDDDKEDVSVVHLAKESAPASLPPLGPLQRPPLAPSAPVFAMRNAFGSWIRAKVVEVTPKGTTPQSSQFSMLRVKFESKNSKTPYKLLPARCVAYSEPATVRMTIGTRCIALFKDTTNVRRESYYSGVVAEVPNPVNNYRYLVFFDDGYAQYVHHQDTRLVVESSSLVWEEVHPFSREFVRKYLLAYPERPMVRLHTSQNIRTEWNGKWWTTRVLKVDASLVQVYFEEDKRTEWIYRGSTRLAPLFLELQAAERTRNRPMPRNRQARQHINMPYVEYTRSEEQEASRDAERLRIEQQERLEQEIRRQRAVAKKSTAPAPLPASNVSNLDTVTSRVVYYTPKNSVKPLKMVSHACSPRCKRTDVLALSDLRTYNPLAKPLLSGWERQLVRLKGHKEVMYRAPCGRRLRDIADLHHYLRITRSDMSVDLFDFSPATHCLAEFVLNKCIVGKKDLSHGKENVPVPCVNYYDDSLPEFCSYNTERTPTAGVPLNLDPDFLCGCDCTDDCQDKSKCACWQMTLEGARTIGMDPRNVGYEYKRLLEPLPSGIYECNVRCKCKHTCLNRVAQHPLQLKLQVFKTLNRGWGIRALNDVPKGAFLCVYAGNLLTDATANLDGLNEGDEYLAELDYIEVVEQMKEGFEEDIPEADKKLDKKESGKESSSSEPSSSEDEESSKGEKEDNDFQPGYIPQPKEGTIFSKRLRKRHKLKGVEEKKESDQRKDDKGKDSDDCITISDDEELREPSRFMAEADMANKFISKYRSVRCLYGKDEACYIMDAKVQGNIGRYLNHSCAPNVFVQNVFVDTHDPRFPWVAFFALSHIKAGTELTWNYNYDIGSVPSKTLYCYCGAANCRGRLL